FLRELRPHRLPVRVRGKVETTDGRTLEGLVMNRGEQDLQLLGDDQKLYVLRRAGDRYRRVTSQADWPTYNGQLGGNRFSSEAEIQPGNVGRLAPRWVFTIPDAARLEATPVVVDGVLYMTGPNQCYALDAGNGRPIWHYQRPQTKGLAGDAAGGINRGVAVA